MSINPEGEKFVILSRHGDLNNPTRFLYNRDSVARPEGVIHLSLRGREQMESLGDLISQRDFIVKMVWVSPQIRALESIRFLLEGRINCEPEIKEDLDDIFAPGPVIERVTIEEWAKLKGNAYDDTRWSNYGHEKPETIISRMRKVFNEMAECLSQGETGILLSHGDTIAWLLNSLIRNQVPDPFELRDSLYPEKGEAFVVVLDSNNRVHSGYLLNPQNTGSSY